MHDPPQHNLKREKDNFKSINWKLIPTVTNFV